MSRPLRIGEFAALTGLSVRTLRFYDAEGLLRPAWIDPTSRYRAYGEAEAVRARRLLALRALGLSLPEIRRALEAPPDERRLLDEAIERLERRIALDRAEVAALRARLATLRPDDVRVRTEAARWVASVRDRLGTPSDVEALAGELLDGLGPTAVGRPGVLWHRCHADGALVAEAFVELAGPVRTRGRVDVYELPRADVALVETEDADAPAEVGYARLRRWMDAGARRLTGPKREVPRADGRLEIQFPFA